MAKRGRRPTQRRVSGTKLSGVRDAKGRSKDIQASTRAYGQDIKGRSRTEGPERGKVVLDGALRRRDSPGTR